MTMQERDGQIWSDDFQPICLRYQIGSDTWGMDIDRISLIGAGLE